MKRLAPLLLVLLLTACASTPTARWVQARESVTTVQDVTIGLHQAELINDADIKAVAPWIIAARNQVNAAYVYLPEGGPTYDKLLATVAEYVARVRQHLREANP